MNLRWIVAALAACALVLAGVWIGIAQAGGTKPQKGSPHAYILGDASIASASKDVVGSAPNGTGAYLVTFKANVTKCALLATLAANGTNGGIETYQASANVVGVNTFAANDTSQSRPFYLALDCAT